jgi:hypothetical protein
LERASFSFTGITELGKDKPETINSVIYKMKYLVSNLGKTPTRQPLGKL